MTAIKFEIGGQLVDPVDASWYCHAPCGCCSGVTLTLHMGGDVLLATEEQAWADWTPNTILRKQQRDAGFTLQLSLRADVKERVVMDCPHTPTWGVHRTPKPDGHGWCVDTCTARSRGRKHLVPGDYTEGPKWSNDRPASLCGRTTSSWDGRRMWLSDTPECAKCQREAQKTAALPEPTQEA